MFTLYNRSQPSILIQHVESGDSVVRILIYSWPNSRKHMKLKQRQSNHLNLCPDTLNEQNI